MGSGGFIAVTGASGFVGRWLCRTLQGAGRPVRAVVRPSSAPVHAAEVAVVDDLSNREAVRGAMRGARAVVHLAGRAHVLHDAAADALGDFRRVNVEGTRVVLEEAIAAGVERFVFVSSVKAVRSASDSVLTALTAPAPDTPYGVSKLEAEEVVRDLASRAGTRAAILRPPLVYGPGMKANALRLFALIAGGVPLPLGAVRNRRSMIFVGNLAAAIQAALDSDAAGGDAFFVSDDHDLSTPALAREIGHALGRPARLVSVPPTLVRLAGRVGDLASALVRVPLTSSAVDSLVGSLAVDPSAFARATGFRPPYPLRAGLRTTAEWYRGQPAARS